MHTHCEYSPDSRTPVAVQALAIKAAGLDVVCATDHNTIEGALRLRDLADGFRVIVGEEISSRDGEIIGLFLEQAIPRDLSAEETIDRIHAQGGLVSVPHPYSHNRIYRLRREALERVWPTIDAIEVFNAREA
ncbi:MAG TPA: PHP domain-containing protein, partial [Candidatus Limnocylindria bacterium]|nr:PHP domain-containing protein [Candidatus Limnocylindria bacterium]